MKTTFPFRSFPQETREYAVFDAREAPFRLHGLYRPQERGVFRRMPQEVAESVSKRVSLLHTHTSGARLRFSTDSDFLAIGAVFPAMTFSSPRSAALSGAGAFCFDLYADGEHCRVLWPEKILQRGSILSFDAENGNYEASFSFEERKMRQITLCFPSFVEISELYLVLKKDASVAEATPYPNSAPVVFYGSSITQGACASRSGNIYPNILSRKFNFDFLNLGFAGACKAERAMIEYLCGLETPLLVFDYDHNVSNPKQLRDTHLPALCRLREAHPQIPFVLLSKPNQHNGKAEALERMEIIRESYEYLQKNWNAPVHFINGQEIFESHDREMMTIDGTHPTDLGFHSMAEALCEVFRLYF